VRENRFLFSRSNQKLEKRRNLEYNKEKKERQNKQGECRGRRRRWSVAGFCTRGKGNSMASGRREAITPYKKKGKRSCKPGIGKALSAEGARHQREEGVLGQPVQRGKVSRGLA